MEHSLLLFIGKISILRVERSLAEDGRFSRFEGRESRGGILESADWWNSNCLRMAARLGSPEDRPQKDQAVIFEKAPRPLPSHSSLCSTLTLHMTRIWIIRSFRVIIYPSHSIKNDEKFCAAHIEEEITERPSLSVPIIFVYGSAILLFIL